MKKVFTKFNVLGLFFILIFLLGIGFIFVKNREEKIAVSNIIEPIAHKYFENNIITTTEEIVVEEVVEERDSSTSSSLRSDYAQNDSEILPEEFLLAVPFTSQAPEKNWEQPWQDACEEAALLMLDAYYKDYNLSPIFSRDEILKMVEWEGERNWDLSISIEQIKQMASEYFGLDKPHPLPPLVGEGRERLIKIIENPTIEDIKNNIVRGNPVLAVANGKVLPNPHFRNGGPTYHALVIKGYDEENFITNDPGTQFGESFKYEYHDLLNAAHDWNDGDVKNGRKVILMVE